MSELPPLKEVYIAPPPPPPHLSAGAIRCAHGHACIRGGEGREEKPKVQPREVAEKAIKEIKSVPPKLMLYALGGAAALILIIGIGVTIYIHSLGSDDDAGAARTTAAARKLPRSRKPASPRPKKAPAPAPSLLSRSEVSLPRAERPSLR